MKSKLFFFHVCAFTAGAVFIVIYFFQKISALPTEGGLAVIALIPIMVVFVIAFGIGCLIFFGVSLLVRHVWRKRVAHR